MIVAAFIAGGGATSSSVKVEGDARGFLAKLDAATLPAAVSTGPSASMNPAVADPTPPTAMPADQGARPPGTVATPGAASATPVVISLAPAPETPAHDVDHLPAAATPVGRPEAQSGTLSPTLPPIEPQKRAIGTAEPVSRLQSQSLVPGLTPAPAQTPAPGPIAALDEAPAMPPPPLSPSPSAAPMCGHPLKLSPGTSSAAAAAANALPETGSRGATGDPVLQAARLTDHDETLPSGNIAADDAAIVVPVASIVVPDASVVLPNAPVVVPDAPAAIMTPCIANPSAPRASVLHASPSPTRTGAADAALLPPVAQFPSLPARAHATVAPDPDGLPSAAALDEGADRAGPLLTLTLSTAELPTRATVAADVAPSSVPQPPPPPMPSPSVATLLARHLSPTPALDLALATVERHVREAGVATLRIDALGIGPVSVEVARQPEGVSLSFTTTTPEGRSALTEAQPRLIAEARTAGFALLDTGVDQGARDRRSSPRAPANARAAAPLFASPASRISPDRFA